MLVERSHSLLLLVDMQERLVPAMAAPATLLANCRLLLKAASRLDVPVIASEQYPKGLGPTVAGLRELLPPEAVLPKTAFACGADAELAARLSRSGRRQIVVAGIEAHVCVLQTALGLEVAGFTPFVVADATTSRAPESKAVAIDRLLANRIEVVTAEMVVFEWLGRAATDEFRELSRLIR
jgi:nicotinamidase-related amidase